MNVTVFTDVGDPVNFTADAVTFINPDSYGDAKKVHAGTVDGPLRGKVLFVNAATVLAVEIEEA